MSEYGRDSQKGWTIGLIPASEQAAEYPAGLSSNVDNASRTFCRSRYEDGVLKSPSLVR